MTQQSTPAATLAPLERLETVVWLDGSTGSNRAAHGHAQIAAATDIDALKAWLGTFATSRATFDSYRREAERLLLWALIEQGKPLSSLTHEDLLCYQRFLGDPQPRSRWVMTDGRKWSRLDARWRPFAGPLAPASRRQSIVILNTMFSWLVTAGYLAGNPLALSRQRQRYAPPRITRLLDNDLWAAVKTTIDGMAVHNDRARMHYARVRWLFSLLYICGLRISEVVDNTMGSFFSRRNAEGELRWWLEVSGKGDQSRIVPATTELINELARYRRALQLSELPLPGEATPLLLPIGRQRRAMTRSAVHRIVKEIFDRTALALREKGTGYEHLAQIAEQASAHWMRHTAASRMADAMDLRHVRDNLGHASISTTNIYLHSEDDRRHAQTERGHKLGW